MTKLIIFDFDGVIITGSNEGYFTCYHKALDAVNVQLDPHEKRQCILDGWGKGHKKQLELLLKEHPDKLHNAITAYEQCYFSPVFHEKIKRKTRRAKFISPATPCFPQARAPLPIAP